MVVRGDALGFRILNMTGRDVALYDPMGSVRQHLPSAGAVQWQNQSIRLAHDFVGLPVYEFRMGSTLTLPPVPEGFHPTRYPAYVLVDFFTAMALAANGIRRPDILVPVASDEDPVTGELRVTALGHVPLR